MRVSRITIKNYRNLKNVDVVVGNTVSIIGENNSGKSNFLKAITLPFLSDSSTAIRKNLSWVDINDDAKNEYYDYILQNKEQIINDGISCEELVEHMPEVVVEVQIKIKPSESFFVKDLSYEIDNEEVKYGLKYEYKPSNKKEIFKLVKHILIQENIDKESIHQVKMNLLPIEYYSYSISVPEKGTISYDALKTFGYSSLEAERDDFSRRNNRLGSKSLVKLLQESLSSDDKLYIEKNYNGFFEQLKKITNIESIFNWQEESEIENAKDFFEHISIMPNMPPMETMLSSIRLGYSDDSLNMQGLGHRNLILLLVLINSLIKTDEEKVFSILTIEEPEAHLCNNNVNLLSSFIKAKASKTTSMQLFYTTHSTGFINKMGLKDVIILHEGKAFSMMQELDEEELDYLTKNPNLDLFKLFFSKKCILFEGISEEMLIRSYLNSQRELHDIELISFHKGYTKIIDIWKKLNVNTNNKLGIIRDYDNQDRAKEKHHKYDDGKTICVRTTEENTLEPEIVTTGNNYSLLKNKYGEELEWRDLNQEELQESWKNAKASDMLKICKDIEQGELLGLEMPKHIKEVIEFMKE